MTTEQTPTTADLMAFYAKRHLEKTRLAAELAVLQEVLDGIAELLAERVPEGVDSLDAKTPHGKVKLMVKPTERYQPSAGKSDEFWKWVFDTRQTGLVGRAVLQTGVKEYIASHGELPPMMDRVTINKVSVHVTAPAPV